MLKSITAIGVMRKSKMFLRAIILGFIPKQPVSLS